MAKKAFLPVGRRRGAGLTEVAAMAQLTGELMKEELE
jgi:hypothetical protein